MRISSRRLAVVTLLSATAVVCFTLGVVHTQRLDRIDRASYDARFDALRLELDRALAKDTRPGTAAIGTAGTANLPASDTDDAATARRERLVADIKEQLRSEMGLLPLRLIRERRSSFVELYTYDSRGQRSYGTAGYLGNGYFITVKHAVAALGDSDGRQSDRTITAVKVLYKGKEIPARVVDAGKAMMEVDPGDWAIIRTRDLDLPALRVDPSFPYEFADPIFRLGNDYSKGVVVSTGYVGQRTTAGLVTSLTDGHPGVSGGGVLDQRGVLVGIPIGRMQGDYRFSFAVLGTQPDVAAVSPAASSAPPTSASE
jgi:S1-C subfamily serine protease